MSSTNSHSFLSNVATVILVLCAVVVTGVVVRQQFFLPEPEAAPVPARTRELDDTDWKRAVGEENLSTLAPVTIVEFFDFQCPFCKRGLTALEHVEETFGDDVTIIRRHLPLTNMHPAAMPAALAAECAHKQDAFDAYHAALFKNQDSLSTDDDLYLDIAREVGISNLIEFKTCLVSEEPKKAVLFDATLAHELGISSTPTLIINRMAYPGAQTSESLEEIVSSMIKN